MIWEYRVITVRPDEWYTSLSECGADGWEYVVSRNISTDQYPVFSVTFKRQKECKRDDACPTCLQSNANHQSINYPLGVCARCSRPWDGSRNVPAASIIVEASRCCFYSLEVRMNEPNKAYCMKCGKLDREWIYINRDGTKKRYVHFPEETK